ncbi:hypothetical protein ADUPG1_002635, partial [Aduncisulcus paluster]
MVVANSFLAQSKKAITKSPAAGHYVFKVGIVDHKPNQGNHGFTGRRYFPVFCPGEDGVKGRPKILGFLLLEGGKGLNASF